MKSCESFLRKVSVRTLTDLNPGFGRPWNKLQIFFVYGTFTMPRKKSFGQNIFWISCTGSKVPFWQNGKIAKMALLNTCTKFKKKIQPKDFFWGNIKVPYTKNIHNLFKGPPNPGFRSVKVQTETFFKKDSRDFKNYFYLGFLWIPRKPGKQN